MEGEEIGSSETEDRRDRPDHCGIAERVEVGAPGHRRPKGLLIVCQDEVGDDAGEVIVPETDDDDCQDRDEQEDKQDKRQRCRLKIGGGTVEPETESATRDGSRSMEASLILCGQEKIL